MARKTDIRLRRSNTINAVPDHTNLNDGELAMNTADGALYFKKSDNTIITAVDNTIMHIDSSTDRVGIGTTSPPQALSVKGRIVELNASGIQIVELKASSDNGQIQVNSSDGTDRILLNSSGTSYIRGGSLAIGVNSADELLHVKGTNGAIAIDANGSNNTASIKFINDNERSRISSNYDSGGGGRLGFWTDTTGGSLLQRMTIKNSGNVGIGTDSPGSLLTVHNSSTAGNTELHVHNNKSGDAAVLKLEGKRTATNDTGQLIFANNGNNVSKIDAQSAADDGNLRFFTSASGSGSIMTERMRIDSSGNVGIGVTSIPGWANLITNGTVAVGGKLYVKQDQSIQGLTGFPGGAGKLILNDAGGNVGIGTTSPSHPLHVVSSGNGEIKAERTGGTAILTQAQASLGRFGTTTNHNLQLMTNSSGRMTITTAGRVGIGTASPLDILHIVSASGDVRQLMDAPTGSDAEIKFAENNVVQYTIGHDAGTGSFVIGTTNVDTQKRLEISDAGVIKFNGAYTFPTSDGTAGQVLKTDGSGALTFQNDSGGGSAGTSITDADNDTKIQVEEGTDDDTIRFDTAGAERMKINSAGNIGIGISTNIDSRLHIADGTAQINIEGTSGDATLKLESTGNSYWNIFNDQSDARKLKFEDNGNGVALTIARDGKVGIGTTSPGHRLHILGSSTLQTAVTKIQRVQASASNNTYTFELDSSAHTSNMTSGGAMAVDVNSGRAFTINGLGNIGIGTSSPQARLDVTGQINIRGTTGLYLYAANGTTFRGAFHDDGGKTRIFADGNGSTAHLTMNGGNVGVGTDNPSRRLHVNGSGATVAVKVEATDGNQASLDLSNTEGDFRIINDGGSLAFYDDADGAERMRIDTSGNLCIGNTSGAAKIDVRTNDGYGLRLESSSGHYFRVAHGGGTEIAGDVTLSAGALTVAGNATFNGSLEINHNPLILDTNPAATYGVSEALRIDDSAGTNDRALQIYEFLHSGARSHRLTFNTNITTTGSAYTYTQGNYGGSSQIEFGNNGPIVFYTNPQDTGGSTTAITPLERLRIKEDGDVRFEGGNVYYDASQNAFNFIDNVPAQFGTANDLQISHNGTDSAINNVTGDLYITNKADDKDIIFRSDDGSGGFTEYLRLDGSLAGSGLTFVRLPDGGNLGFGANNDLRIFHDGSNTSINNFTNHLNIRNDANDGDITLQSDDGSGGVATYFQLDGSQAQSRFLRNVKWDDGIQALFGTSDDLRIKHDGTNSTIDNFQGDLLIRQQVNDKDIIFQSDNGSGGTADYIRLDGDTGNLNLYHYGSLKFNTTATGVNITGNTVISGDLTVSGTNTVLNTTTLDVEDKNITLNKGSGDTSGSADGAGITIQDAVNASTDATFLWNASTDSWRLSHRLYAPNYVVEDTNAVIYRNSNDLELKTYAGYDINLMPAGKVGIGTTTPSELLEVAGDTKVTNLGVNAGPQDYLSSLSARLVVGGNAVINNNSPLLYLRANGTSNISDLRFQNSLKFTNGSGAIQATIASSGNVGIGTDSPAAKLHISGNSDVSDENCMLIIDDVDGSAGSRIPAIMFRSNTGGTVTNQGRIRGTDSQGMVLSASSALSNDLVIQAGMIGVGAPSNHTFDSNITAYHATNAIKSQVKLWTNTADNTGTEGGAIEWVASGDKTAVGSKIAATRVASGGKMDMRFYTGRNSDSDHEKMRILSTGNVGIGTTQPGQKLEVAGNVKLKGSSSHFINLEPSGSVGNANIAFDGSNFTFTSNSSSADMVFQTSSTTRMTLHQDGNLDIYNGNASNTFNFGRNSNEKLNILVNDANVELNANQDSDSNGAHRFKLNRAFGGTGVNDFEIQKGGTNQLRLDTNGYLYQNNSTNAYIHRDGDKLVNQTQHGYIRFGPANSGFGHIETDRAEFYFNKKISVDSGIVNSYNEDLVLSRQNTTKATFGTTNTDLTNTRVRIAGALQRTFGNSKRREYRIASSAGTESFLLGKIEHGGGSDGAVEGIVRFAYDYGDTANNCAIHFNFAVRSGTARGTWWYEHDDDDDGSDVVKVVLIDDGSGGMFVWVTVGDFAECYVETTWRHCSVVTDSGTLTAATLTTGTTLFDTSNDPTSEMHIGSLYAHNDLYLQNKKLMLDADADTHIQAPFDDLMSFTAGGTAIALLSGTVGFTPSNGGSIPLGSSGVPWSNIYGNNYYVGSTQIIDSSINLTNIGSYAGSGSVVLGTVSSGNNYSELTAVGSLELCRTDANAFIDFKSDSNEDYDCRIQQNSNGLIFQTGGNGSTATALTLDSARNAQFASMVDIPSKLRHLGDTDNYFSFATTDTQSFVTGNSTRLQITNSLVRLNQENNNQDFAVYSANSDNILYVDASADKVGIGTATPAALFNANGSQTIGWTNLANSLILAGTTTGGIGIDTNEIAVKGDHVYFGTIDAKDIVFRTNGANARMTILSGGQTAINAGSARTTGGTAMLTIAGSGSLINMGPSNSDNMYVRRQGAGLFQMQTYNNDNAGHLELEPYGGKVGISTGGSSPLSTFHVQETALSGATATTYAHMILEDTDAQMDLTSSHDGTWGSAINFKEHYSTNSSLNDVWSIARKTTNGDGDSSLNFNFGTNNQHDNTTRQKFYSDGKIDAGGTIETGASLIANSSELVQRRVGGWTVPLQTVIGSSYGSNLNDYVYLKAPGNSTNAHGILLVGDNSLYYGRTSIETGGVTNSTEAPLDESVAFKITQDGDARFKTRLGIGVFPATNNNSNNNDTTEANRVAPLHIRTTANSGAGTQVAQIIENYANDYGTTPLKLALDFKGQDSNNATNFVRLAQVSVNDTDYGDNNEATSHFIMGMTQNGNYAERVIFSGLGHMGLGDTTAFHPTNQINTGNHMKPDVNGKFLNFSGGAHGAFINLLSSTTTNEDQVGGIYFTRTAGQGDAHKQIAGIDAVRATYSGNDNLAGGDLRFFTKPNGDATANPRMKIIDSGVIEFLDGSGNADMYWDKTDLRLNDSNRIRLGTSGDLQLYHDGNESFIRDTGTGPLAVDTNGTEIRFISGGSFSNGKMTRMIVDGAVELYHDNNKKLETTSTGVTVTGLLSATTKSFDIEHPTKEGKRLRHGVLEGPEHGVYVRGKHNGHIIELPDYWTGLVDEDSITVQLTAIGKAQELYIENIEDNKVYIGSERTIENYFYYVQAERKDVDKIEVEYDSESEV